MTKTRRRLVVVPLLLAGGLGLAAAQAQGGPTEKIPLTAEDRARGLTGSIHGTYFDTAPSGTCIAHYVFADGTNKCRERMR